MLQNFITDECGRCGLSFMWIVFYVEDYGVSSTEYRQWLLSWLLHK